MEEELYDELLLDESFGERGGYSQFSYDEIGPQLPLLNSCIKQTYRCTRSTILAISTFSCVSSQL